MAAPLRLREAPGGGQQGGGRVGAVGHWVVGRGGGQGCEGRLGRGGLTPCGFPGFLVSSEHRWEDTVAMWRDI